MLHRIWRLYEMASFARHLVRNRKQHPEKALWATTRDSALEKFEEDRQWYKRFSTTSYVAGGASLVDIVQSYYTGTPLLEKAGAPEILAYGVDALVLGGSVVVGGISFLGRGEARVKKKLVQIADKGYKKYYDDGTGRI